MNITHDTHIHTTLSRHPTPAPATMEQYIERALQIGLSTLYFTEHMEFGNQFNPPLEVPRYFAELARLRQAYAGRITLRSGVELGLDDSSLETLMAAAKDLVVDYRIASLHGNPTRPSYHAAQQWAGKTNGDVQNEYLQDSLRLITQMDDFDCLGHLTYYCRWSPLQRREIVYADAPDAFDALFRFLIERGRGIEINTSSYRQFRFFMPDGQIVRRYRELGGEVVTIGSDAHGVQELGRDLDRAGEMLKAAGFRYFTVFEARTPKFLPLD